MKLKAKLLLPVMAVFSSHCQALDWLFEPNFGATERYTDNLRMQIKPTRDNFITTLSPGVLLGYQAENHALNATFKWNELVYHGESSLDFSEKIANLSQDYTGERFKADLSAQYAEQSSINTQLDLDGTGNIQIQVPRTTRSVSPGLTYNLTELDALQLNYNYVDVAFGRTPGQTTSLGFSDYDNQQFSATFNHTFSERLSINLTGSYSKFQSGRTSDVLAQDINDPVLVFVNGVPRIVPNVVNSSSTFSQKSTTLNYQAGFQYAFSEQMKLSLSAGMRNTDTQTDQIVTRNDTQAILSNFSRAGTSNGRVFSANLNRNSEWGGFTLSAGQQLNPASTGSQQQSTTFSANLRYNLTERWTTGVTATYLMSESTSTFNSSSVSNNRTYSTLSPNIRWRWTPEIFLDLSYAYRQQKYDSLNQTSIGNNLQLQFSYQPQINRQVK